MFANFEIITLHRIYVNIKILKSRFTWINSKTLSVL